MKHYKTKSCQTCQLFDRCTKNKAGRLIERTEHAELIEANKQRVILNKTLYRRRQAIVEHPYGIVKRQWGFYYIMSKRSIKHASADVGLIFTAFNLRRIFNIIDHNMLKKYMEVLGCVFSFLNGHFKPLYAIAHSTLKYIKPENACFFMPLNRLYLSYR